jgi:hypothetical protein
MLGGALALFLIVLSLSIIIGKLHADPQASRSASAGFFRALGMASHFKSVLITTGAEPVAVSFDDIARAIEKGDLLSHPTSRVHRSEPPPHGPPNDGSYDGSA